MRAARCSSASQVEQIESESVEEKVTGEIVPESAQQGSTIASVSKVFNKIVILNAYDSSLFDDCFRLASMKTDSYHIFHLKQRRLL